MSQTQTKPYDPNYQYQHIQVKPITGRVLVRKLKGLNCLQL